ncbi:Voltage-dependent calcium channel subunit alpha-2/delta-2 [Hondaea fermentalgiana]|uniref:Voltage-dependent calcium channel subunit alpha-2/delta-2 n=1 Tax=Hondaea fermentalgiana TaxID=2315210 RepID=A0A2R5FYK6_9STRA|nr:Voltage-dependent calcium channel subunit alpha-2/delta-2 [Hondaea fermentalgiana]|eukprot:GBG23837.1 Voltage-dependent calcium channel subunit alpha-2/delta-2 [Hondaea fermentalgiana]
MVYKEPSTPPPAPGNSETESAAAAAASETSLDATKGHAGAEAGEGESKETRVSISKEKEGHAALLTIHPPGEIDEEVAPHHVCCVIDVSGSMGADASVKDINGGVESSGLSVLDVVKHSISTILATMSDNDYISLVTFHSVSKIICERVQCDDAGKMEVQDHLDRLHPQAATNLWSGLRDGLNLISKDPQAKEGLASIFLFTDGMPNVEPPRGHIPTLERHIETEGRLPCTVNTFGFGYNMDATLLQSIARVCAGSYAFIPDAGMVGTVFIHACANTFSTFAMDTRLSISLPDGLALTKDCLDSLRARFALDMIDWGLVLRLGALQYAQPRSVYLEFDKATDLVDVGLTFRKTCAPDLTRVEADVVPSSPDTAQNTIVAAQRSDLARALASLCETNFKPQLASDVKALCENLQNATSTLSNPSARAAVEAMLADAKGQILEAVSTNDAFERWGQRYLRSLLSAHSLEVCNNFKDPGVQIYARGARFLTIRDKAEASFDAVPPPKPSRRQSAEPVSREAMRNLYLNVSRGCFAPDCVVDMAPGSELSQKPISEIKRGDHVLSWGNKPARVECVIRFELSRSSATSEIPDPLVSFPGGLRITPYHPMYISASKAWAFPCDLPEASLSDARNVDAVYNLLLADGHTVCVNGYTCVTLGHEFTEPCVAHPYFGSPLVRRDLAALPGFKNGSLTLTGDCFLRDPATLQVCGIDLNAIATPKSQ